MNVHYLDTSALAKLVVPEHESAALQHWLVGTSGPLVSSVLAIVELRRAVARAGRPPGVAAPVLDGLGLVALSRTVAERAGLLQPASLRSLDAVHLATALEVGDDLATFVAYDERLLRAARDAGLPVLSPRP